MGDVDLTERGELVLGFDALGDEVGPDLLGEDEQSGGQGAPRWIGVDAAHRIEVQFHDVRAQVEDVAQAREAGSGVVDRDPHP